jgi:hypothetical protein
LRVGGVEAAAGADGGVWAEAMVAGRRRARAMRLSLVECIGVVLRGVKFEELSVDCSETGLQWTALVGASSLPE